MSFTIDKFMGLQQNIDYPDLKMNYCHLLQNIDIDDPVGVMRVRDGFGEKYDDDNLANYPFTNLISAYEFRFDKTSETILIVNDDGTLKTMTNGGNPSSLTLPTGATLESGFKNQYLGWKDHVLITTGNGATDYMLWFGYIDRENDDGTGLFGNNEEFTGYKLLKSQLIPPSGVFSGFQETSAAYIGGYWYIPLRQGPNTGSKWIEKRNANFQLVERIEVYDDAGDLLKVSLCADSDYIYMGTDDGVYKVDPDGWVIVASQEAGPTDILDICCDDVNIYTITDTRLDQIAKSDLSLGGDPDDTVTSGLKITCSPLDASGIIYFYSNGNVRRRTKAALTVDTHAVAHTSPRTLHYDANPATDVVLLARTPGTDEVLELDIDDLTTSATNQNVDDPYLFLDDGSNTRVFSSSFGLVQDYDGYTVRFPDLIGICVRDTIAGGDIADTGTYFYKVAIVDSDGQEYTLSDPIVAPVTAASKKIKLRIICNEAQINDLYRVDHINIYRGFNDDSSNDAQVPATDYKFLKKIDINSSGWTNDSNLNIYYFDYDDNIPEAEISSATYFENSGIEDTVKSRYINGKHIDFIDNQLHLGNFYYDGDNFPNRVIISSQDSPDALAFYNYYDFDVGDGEEIKGISSSFGRSVIFKTRKFRTYFNGSPERNFSPGISGEGGFTKVNENIYYISDQGIYVFDGNKGINVYYPVLVDFKTAKDASLLANVAVGYIESKDRLVFTIRNFGAFVWNIKYNTWTRYTSTMGFRGIYKNYENEYIGWDVNNFNIIFDSTYVNDGEDYGGGNGTAITIDYESPLLLGRQKGNLSILGTHRHRLYKGSDTITFTVYDYTLTGGSSVATQALSGPTSGSKSVARTYFFNQVMGEAFQFRINGTILGGDFKYYGMTIDYREGGLLYR